MRRLFLFPFLCLMTLLMSAKCNQADQYRAPDAEDCKIISSYSPEKETDVGTCFCMDERLNKDTFDSILLKRTEKAFNGHPMRSEALRYLAENREQIIKTKEYEVPFLAYCRGFGATNPTDQAKLENWAETNRVQRIKAENKK